MSETREGVERMEQARREMVGVPKNAIDVRVSVSVDLRALADWPPETTAAFMAGVAQVVSAERFAHDLIDRRRSHAR